MKKSNRDVKSRVGVDKKKIPRERAKDTIEDLHADDMLTSGKPWIKPRQRKKKG